MLLCRSVSGRREEYSPFHQEYDFKREDASGSGYHNVSQYPHFPHQQTSKHTNALAMESLSHLLDGNQSDEGFNFGIEMPGGLTQFHQNYEMFDMAGGSELNEEGVCSVGGTVYRQCPFCHKKITGNHLKRHIRTQHTSMERVKCQHCNKYLKNQYSLETHITNYHKLWRTER